MHAVPAGQLVAQGAVLWVWIARHVGTAQGRDDEWAWPASVGVGREVPPCRAVGVRPTVNTGHGHKRCPPVATHAQASSPVAHTTLPDHAMARCVSTGSQTRPVACRT